MTALETSQLGVNNLNQSSSFNGSGLRVSIDSEILTTKVVECQIMRNAILKQDIFGRDEYDRFDKKYGRRV